MSVKTSLKKLLKTKSISDDTVEITRMFVYPFIKKIKGRNISIDDAITLFFNANTREVFSTIVHTEFKIPGKFFNGSKAVDAGGPRLIEAGSKLLIVLDKIDESAKIEVISTEPSRLYLLTKNEFRLISDKMAVVENA